MHETWDMILLYATALAMELAVCVALGIAIAEVGLAIYRWYRKIQ